MNRTKKLVLAAGLTLLGGAAAFGEYARGYFNNWANDCPLTRPEGGNYYSGTFQAHAGGSSGLKFDLDGNCGSSTWGGTSASAATVNQTIGSASRSQSGDLPMDVSDGYYYTFHLAGDYSWSNRTYVVMKTTYQPSTILDVVDDSKWVGQDDVTLTAICSAGTAEQISPEETFYILYTTDGDWNTATLVEMSGNGLTREGTIPGQEVGTTVQYKVFNTTMPTNCLTTETILSSPNDIQKIDFCMLSLKEGSYTASDYIDYMPGNAWHCPTNWEPYASMRMRTPGTPEEVTLGDHPYVLLGVSPSSGSDSPSKVELKYKAGTNRWETLTMEPLQPGDGWQPKFDGNAYYASFIPTNKFTVGMKVKYYFYLEYANSSLFGETSVGTTDQNGSIGYLGEGEGKAHPFQFTVVEPPPVGFNDPQGTPIEDPAVIEWLTDNGITQADIDVLGKDAAATDKMYECYLANCDLRMQDAGALLGLSAISVSNGVVSVTVELVRKAPFGTINGVLNFYGARDLADGFGSSPIAKGSVSFGADDPTFATDRSTGSVTQTATANIGNATEKFFKAAIEVDLPERLGGVQLWENGPYWAECNVGAATPEESGYYFWWGDTVGYTRSGGTLTSNFIHPEYYTGVTWVSSTGIQMGSSPFDYESCPTYEKENAELLSEGYIDSTTNLVAAHDAATAHLGAPWRMPTSAEIEALVSNCTTEWITTNGVSGRLVTGKGAYANRSIFLPAAGYGSGSSFYDPGSQGDLWASTPISDFSCNAWRLNFNSSNFRQSDYSRYLGQPVRPVRDPAD